MLKRLALVAIAVPGVSGCATHHEENRPPAEVRISEPQTVDRSTSTTDLPTGTFEVEVVNEAGVPLAIRTRGGRTKVVVEPGQARLVRGLPAGVSISLEAVDEGRKTMARVLSQTYEAGTRFRWVVSAEAVAYPVP